MATYTHSYNSPNGRFLNQNLTAGWMGLTLIIRHDAIEEKLLILSLANKIVDWTSPTGYYSRVQLRLAAQTDLGDKRHSSR
ncbi:hypothetical protein CBOM_05286 [Ceraceosorus bombacis]|uniref:Uncharacterized protein n=1 Tax=Ceraceosorus bombacis TaxID=401625 RepID=A0A0P1BQZ4_9BASI|nr:hypothetical protein CBOM_05286 [Ceraceosorus bombacis]